MDNKTDRPGVIIFPPVLMGSSLLAALALHRFWPLPIGMRPVTMALGIILSGLGIGSAAWGRITLVKRGTNVSPIKPAIAIATAGPYRFTRNPLYVGVMSLFAGVSLLIGTWWGFVILIPTFLILHHGVVLREERYLERKFGETYLNYKREVRRYL